MDLKNLTKTFRGRLIILSIIVFLIALVYSNTSEDQLTNEVKLNINSNPFALPENFQKKYTSIFDDRDSSFKRRTYSISIPSILSKQEIENNIRHSLNNYLSDKEDVSAVMMYVYVDNANKQDNAYIARGIFAPNGDWSKPDEFKSYQENKFVIDFEESYFREEKDKGKLFNINDNVYLKKGIGLSSKKDNWEDSNIIFKTSSISKAKILDKAIYYMPDFKLVRYRVVLKNKVVGWINSNDIFIKN